MEKERFLRKAQRCGFTEKLTLYKMLLGEELLEHPSQGFWEVDKQIGKIKVNTLYLNNIGMNELASKVFWHYQTFHQYLQNVKCDMLFICKFGIDRAAKE